MRGLCGRGQPTSGQPRTTFQNRELGRCGFASVLRWSPRPPPVGLLRALHRSLARGKPLKINNEPNLHRRLSTDVTSCVCSFSLRRKTFRCLCSHLRAGGVFPGTQGVARGRRRPGSPGFVLGAARQPLVGEAQRQMLPEAPCDRELCHGGFPPSSPASPAGVFLTLTRRASHALGLPADSSLEDKALTGSGAQTSPEHRGNLQRGEKTEVLAKLKRLR